MDGIAHDFSAAGAGDRDGEPRAVHRDRELRDAAFAALVDRQGRFLYRVAFGLLRNQQDAEDAVQETLLKLYRGDAWQAPDRIQLDRIQPDRIQDEQAYLARSVWRTGLDRIGSAGAKAMRHAEDVSEMELASAAPTPEQVAMAGNERELMRALIEGLPESLRQPLVLSAVEGMRSGQVAAVLEIPEGTVRTRVMRAKAELRRRFLAICPAPAEVRL
jgi:RNA polymerase sigma-70 factor (ECF subfamily)